MVVVPSCGFLLVLYLEAVMFIQPNQLITSAILTQRYFQFQANPARGPVRLGDPWVAPSRKSCARYCMSTFQNCSSFLFSQLTRKCTPSAFINDKQPLPSSEEGDFFQSFYCDTSQGFSVKTYGKTVACLALFGPATYNEADAKCQSKGAYLMSVKTEEKLFLLSNNVSGNQNVWVGCDDLLEEGRFMWKEDGQTVTSVEHTAVFDPADPLTDDDGEDCVGFDPTKPRLRDYNCSLSLNYVCELPYH